MTKRTFCIIGVLVILFISLAAFSVSKIFSIPEKTHYHAGFVVFENNKKIDFSDNKYMYIKPCLTNANEEKETKETIQIEKAHLHDNVGDIVHIERKGAVWGDLFTNIKFPIDYSKAVAYINGKVVPNFKSQPIKAYESLVLFIGDNDKSLLSQAVTKEYIENQEAKGGSCSD